MAFKISSVDCTENTGVNLYHSINYTFDVLAIESRDAYSIAKSQEGVPILARADFSTISNPSFAGFCYFFAIDNLANQFLIKFESPASSSKDVEMGSPRHEASPEAAPKE